MTLEFPRQLVNVSPDLVGLAASQRHLKQLSAPHDKPGEAEERGAGKFEICGWSEHMRRAISLAAFAQLLSELFKLLRSHVEVLENEHGLIPAQ